MGALLIGWVAAGWEGHVSSTVEPSGRAAGVCVTVGLVDGTVATGAIAAVVPDAGVVVVPLLMGIVPVAGAVFEPPPPQADKKHVMSALKKWSGHLRNLGSWQIVSTCLGTFEKRGAMAWREDLDRSFIRAPLVEE